MTEGVSIKLRGEHPYKLDPKNRVAIPSGWGSNSGGVLLMLPAEKCGYTGIKVLTETQFEQIEEDIKQDPEIAHSEMREVIAWMNSSCVEAALNSQGKLLIPKKMHEMAQLSVDVLVVGCRQFFEIWDKDIYNKMTVERNPIVSRIRAKYGL